MPRKAAVPRRALIRKLVQADTGSAALGRKAAALPFSPSDPMRAYAKACIDPTVEPTREARCKSAGTTTARLDYWHDEPDFPNWLKGEIERLLKEDVWEVWAAVHRLAMQGNIPAAKLHLARFDPGAEKLESDGGMTFKDLAELAAAAEKLPELSESPSSHE